MEYDVAVSLIDPNAWRALQLQMQAEDAGDFMSDREEDEAADAAFAHWAND